MATTGNGLATKSELQAMGITILGNYTANQCVQYKDILTVGRIIVRSSNGNMELNFNEGDWYWKTGDYPKSIGDVVGSSVFTGFNYRLDTSINSVIFTPYSNSISYSATGYICAVLVNTMGCSQAAIIYTAVQSTMWTQLKSGSDISPTWSVLCKNF